MRLPNGEHAIVELAKLRDYCLNDRHPRGRHKARVFASVLGITQAEADFLREALRSAAVEEEATKGELDEYGQRYVLDFSMAGPGGRARVRSIWIVIVNENVPRLVTCHVL